MSTQQDKYIQKLINLFQSLGKERKVLRKKFDQIPQDFGWKETEEDYQKAQAKWLAEVEERKRQKKKSRK